MADNPDWEKILRFLKAQNGRYRREATEAEIKKEDFTPPQVAERMLAEDLCAKLDIESDREELRQLLTDLDNTLDLVDFSKTNNTAILSLTPDGFEVSHERELSKQRDKTNTALVVFTVILVLVNLIGYFPSTSQAIATVMILVSLLVIVIWTDILDLSFS